MPGLSEPQAAGILLVAGAAIFWSIVVAAIVATVRTGSLPFKDASAVPAKEFYESITARPRWWLAVNVTFSTGIILTAMGLTLLRSLIREAGGTVIADLGLVVFVVATTLWLVLTVFNLSLATWAAEETGRTGSVPPAAEAWPRAFEQFVQTYMVLAYIATALFGAGIVTSGLLDAWAGWTAVVAGIAGACSVILTGASLAIPLLIHIVPAILGVLLLLQPG